MLMGGGVIGYAIELYSDCCAQYRVFVKSMLVVKFVCILEVCHNPRTPCIYCTLYGLLRTVYYCLN